MDDVALLVSLRDDLIERIHAALNAPGQTMEQARGAVSRVVETWAEHVREAGHEPRHVRVAGVTVTADKRVTVQLEPLTEFGRDMLEKARAAADAERVH